MQKLKSSTSSNFEHDSRTKLWVRIYTLPILAALIGSYQLVVYGYPYGHDWLFELIRLTEFTEALRVGQVIPFWGEDLYQGYGSPIFLFYAPLYNALSSLGLIIGLPITNAAILTLVLLLVCAAIGMAGLMWEIAGRKTEHSAIASARIAAIAYVLAPYLLANMLVRNASAEFTALCLAPYPFWGLAMLYHNRGMGFIVLTVGMFVAVLAHNLTALIMAFTTLLISILMFLPEKRYCELIKSITAIIAGIGLSAWFWLPALGLKSKVNIEEMTKGKFDFHTNFHSLNEIFSYNTFYSVGWLSLAILFISGILILFIKNNIKRRLISILFLSATFFLFLQTTASTIIWDHVPLLPLFQFTWRMAGPFSLIAALLAGLLFCHLKKLITETEIIAILLISANVIPILRQYQPLPDDVANMIPSSITPQGIRQLGLPATVLNEYLPVNADITISKDVSFRNTVFQADTPATININSASGSHMQFTKESDENTTLHISRWYFSGWYARVDGQVQAVESNQWGTIQLKVPAGKNEIEVWMGQPTLRKAGFIISGIIVVIFGLTIIRQYKSRKQLGES